MENKNIISNDKYKTFKIIENDADLIAKEYDFFVVVETRIPDMAVVLECGPVVVYSNMSKSLFGNMMRNADVCILETDENSGNSIRAEFIIENVFPVEKNKS